MLILFLKLVIVSAINIPRPVSMKNLDKLNPKDSIFNSICSNVFNYRFYIFGLNFLIISFVMIFIAFKNRTTSKETKKDQAEEEILYLEGRKLLLPEGNALNGKRKYKLSEDFTVAGSAKSINEIYRETLIKKLGVLKY